MTTTTMEIPEDGPALYFHSGDIGYRVDLPSLRFEDIPERDRELLRALLRIVEKGLDRTEAPA